MKRFGSIGAAGYIALRHLRAIKDTGNDLVVAIDINDSVGVLTVTSQTRISLQSLNSSTRLFRTKSPAGSLTISRSALLNYLHLPHIKFALRNGVDVICEKPLVIKAADLDVIRSYETTYGSCVNSILQLRLHPAIVALRDKVQSASLGHVFDVDLTYMTSRGKWYMRSWKGLDQKSGGVATNIGIHFYDILHFIFGRLLRNEVHYRDEKTCAGYLEYERARVRWFLSIDANHLPENAVRGEKLTYRSITIDDEELEFSDGFTDLHTQSYERILAGDGYGIDDNRIAIETVEAIRVADTSNSPTNPHPLLSKVAR